jgi:hypothetical protein
VKQLANLDDAGNVNLHDICTMLLQSGLPDKGAQIVTVVILISPASSGDAPENLRSDEISVAAEVEWTKEEQVYYTKLVKRILFKQIEKMPLLTWKGDCVEHILLQIEQLIKEFQEMR